MKKNKKKPKTDDEDAADIKELISRASTALTTQYTETEIDKCEIDIELSKTEWLMGNHLVMDENMFDQLNRKVSILDIDVAELEVVLRTDLDVPLTPYQPLPPIEEEFKDLLQAKLEDE